MQGRAARRLATLAAPLQPAREPFYVRLPVPPRLEARYPATGWYWEPKDHPYSVYLGATFESAAVNLRQQLSGSANGSG